MEEDNNIVEIEEETKDQQEFEDSSGLPDEGSTPLEDGATDVSSDTVVNTLVDIVKERIEEDAQNDIQGDSISDNTDAEKDSVLNDQIDYSDILTDIQSELVAQKLLITEIKEESEITIFDKAINDYNVEEGLLAIVLVVLLSTFLWNLFEKFIPKIGRKR